MASLKALFCLPIEFHECVLAIAYNTVLENDVFICLWSLPAAYQGASLLLFWFLIES